MNTKLVRTLYKKELTDILRDIKTIIVMVMVPLVLYPIIFFGSLLVTTSILTKSTEKEYKVAVVNEYADSCEASKKLLSDSLENKDYHFAITEIGNDSDYEKMIRNSEYDIIIKPESNDEFFDVTLYCMNANVDSANASSMVNTVFTDYSKKIVEDKLKGALPEYDELTKEPFVVETQNYATKEESTGMVIGYIMPFFMIVSVLMGSFTIAIDVSVGERERGTLETLLTLPISNLEMMLAKFFAVTTIGVASVLLNAASFVLMGLVVGSALKATSPLLGGFDIATFIPSVLIMLPLVILFTMFVSAVCLCVDFTAKSVKEANNLTTPILLVFMLAAGVSVIPYVKLDYKWALVPIMNVTLLIKELFTLNFKADLILIVFLATLVYTIVSVFVMTKLFSSEDILFGEGVRSFRLFEKRANMKEGQIPGMGDNVFLFALILILSNYLGTGIFLKNSVYGAAVCQIIMLILPIAYAWYIKADLKELFSLKKPRTVEILGTICFVVAAKLLANPLIAFLIEKFPKLYAQNEKLGTLVTSASFPVSLIVVGFLPALAEEIVFRGFLYGSMNLKKRLPVWTVWVISAVAFAAYHLNLFQFIYVTLFGLLMAYMIYNSKSIFVTALFHLLNNSMSVCYMYISWLGENAGILEQSSFDSKSLTVSLSIGFVLLIAGFLLSDRKYGIFREKSHK